ncbi:unnamed protein product [Leptosia nina]|uniref:Secreted protein n=1 Tax=Leptosia nina TaxID=320188 RepID=A0AAV1IVE7_9NEOP
MTSRGLIMGFVSIYKPLTCAAADVKSGQAGAGVRGCGAGRVRTFIKWLTAIRVCNCSAALHSAPRTTLRCL